MEPWLVTLISVAGGGIVALAARWIDRRRGVPAEVDAAIDSHVEFVVQTLKDKIGILEQAKTDCMAQLAAEVRAREDERDGFEARISTLEGEKDTLQGQVARLLLRLNGGTG